MNGTRALSIALFLSVACSGPPGLRVTIESDEPALSKVEIEVRSADSGDRAQDIIDCSFKRGSRTGRCPFKSSKVEWGGCTDTLCDPINFILFGKANTRLFIGAQGLDSGGGVVTATSGVGMLPGGPSETSLVRVMPRAGTNFSQCGAVLSTRELMPRADESFVTLLPRGQNRYDILAIAGGVSSIFNYRFNQHTHKGCVLTKEAEWPACAINTAPGAVVLGHLAGGTEPEIVAMCNLSNSVSQLAVTSANQPKLLQPRAQLRLPAGWRTSMPVLVDLDGDGRQEIAVLVSPPSNPASDLELRVWSPDAPQAAISMRLTGIKADATAVQPIGPIVYPLEGKKEGLLITGYEGGLIATYEAGSQLKLITVGSGHPQARLSKSDWGPSLVRRGEGPPLVAHRFHISTGMTPHLDMIFSQLDALGSGFRDDTPLSNPPTGLPSARSTRIAIGDLHGDGSQTAVVGFGAQIFLFPILATQTATRAFALRPLTTDPLIGGLTVLLANIDHRRGANIIAFNPATSSVIFAIDEVGRPVAGFPLQVGNSSAPLRVALEDLDDDGALEIVTLSFNALKVFSIGPMSYDKDHTPWPLPFCDLRSSSATLREGDPLRTSTPSPP